MSKTSTNWLKVIGLISALLGIAVISFPIPDNYKVYILGAETMINGGLSYWQGKQVQAPQKVQS